MPSEQFRRQLRREADQWRIDGLITPEQHHQLSQQYEFNQLDEGARDRFILILLGLGSILLGLGVITFVAANWQAIPRSGKLALLLSLFFVVNIAGFYLWRRPLAHGRQGWQQRLGQGLLLLGALVLGANLALGGQLFHRSGSFYELCLIWGLGVLAMAFGLRLTILGLLALLLMGIGYWSGMQEVMRAGSMPGLSLLLQYMPLVSGGLFTLLAYVCRSRLIFGVGAIALVSSLLISLTDINQQVPGMAGILMALAFTLPPALLWSYDDGLWWQLRRQTRPLVRQFRPLAQALALVFLTSLTYLFSFRLLWSNSSDQPPFSTQLSLAAFTPELLLNPNLIVYGGLTLVGWIYLMAPRHRGDRWRLAQGDAVMLVLLLAVGSLALVHWGITPIQIVAVYLFNVLLFLLAAGFIRQGLARGNRLLFWYGLVTLAAQLVSRMFEYNTGLLLKSAVFLLCGVGIMLFGLWFERHIRTLAPATTFTPAPQEETL